jgi:protein MpaA
MDKPQLRHSHNYSLLMRRWRTLSKKAGLKFSRIGEADGYPCYEICSPALSKNEGIYLSAGIHGDEAGAVLGLLQWAESHRYKLSRIPLLIYPCLNPWGLENNSRFNPQGLDLNRVWDGSATTLIAKIMQKIRDYHFRISICLHEDYDGQGIYLYAPGGRQKVRKIADAVLSATEKIIPRDQRKKIDGRRCTNGVIFPRLSKPPAEGIPEALFLYKKCGGVNFTLETPSELGIDRRAAAHACMIEESLKDYGLT